MTTSPVPLALSWNPFGASGATPKHAVGELLTLGGIAAAQLKTPVARDSTSLWPDGHISTNKIVSEVTTVSISSNTAYAVDTESRKSDDGLAGAQEETITSSLSDSSTQSQISDADGTTSKSTSTIGDPSVSISFTPVSTQPTVILPGVLSLGTFAPKG